MMAEQLGKERRESSSSSEWDLSTDEKVFCPRQHKKSVSSSKSSFHKRGKTRVPPTQASKWNLHHLEDIGIQYRQQATSLSEFMSKLKTNSYVKAGSLTELPTLSQKLIDIVKGVWTFSFDLNDEGFDRCEVIKKVQEVEDTLKEFNSKQSKMESVLADQLTDFQNKRLFYHWQFSLEEFLNYCCIFLSRWQSSETKMGKFASSLFAAFGRICHLTPETGESVNAYGIVNNTLIYGTPDIRYVTYNRIGQGLMNGQKILIVTEVNKANLNVCTPAEQFDFTDISADSLGQHGIQLLMERTGSFFYPRVVGIICIGSKIIFTYLEVKKDHFGKIQFKREVDQNKYKSYISYTRPFDIMDADDRKAILEPLMWLGNLQMGAPKFLK